MKKDTKTGFIITYFQTSKKGLELLKENIKTISREDYYIILASHSPVDTEIQEMVDYYFFQSKNVVDERKYSHGVAESNLIEISMKHLKDQSIDWTYKITYDIEIVDINEFKRWDKREYQFVSCNWGKNIICTNSFFSNVDFILENVKFYNTVQEMFARNNVLENCWEYDFVSKGLTDKIFSFRDKQDFYGKNKIDILYYDYNQVDFTFSETEGKFYIMNRSSLFEKADVKIFDYYTDLCVYTKKGFNLAKDVRYFIMPPFNKNMKYAKNGFYLEIYLEDITIRKNILVEDFDLKHKLSRKFKQIKNSEVKFNEYSDFHEMNIYSDFKIDIERIKNFVDVGSCYGMASISFIERGIKTYLIEADPENVKKIKTMWDKNSQIKIIDKAISTANGSVDFYTSDGPNSVVSSLYEIDANGNSIDRKKMTVDSITPNTLIEKYIEESSIDLMKIDIEGGEWDLFETITDANLCKIKRMIIEFHNNDNYKVMNILTKLAMNNFKFKLAKWSETCGDFIVENKMGVVYAEKI